jgi:hypothetical protein
MTDNDLEELTDLYHEQDRLWRKIGRWPRLPFGRSQVELRRKKIAGLRESIDVLYARLGGNDHVRKP